MQTISLCDTLRLSRQEAEGIAFTCETPEAIPVPADSTNLAWRAAHLLLEESQKAGKAPSGGVAIHLEKHIPSQAGLGGGSSDAAATLLGLNALLGLGWQKKELIPLAAQLGSDVPFFLLGGTVTARGRGELLTPLPDAPEMWLVLVKPDVGVSTAWAYSALDEAPERASNRGTKRLEKALIEEDGERYIAWQSNDFELPVFERYPELAWLHDELRMAGALAAHLCGSGSALYGIASSEAAAQRIASLLRAKYPLTSVAKTRSRNE
jgi:4-diphosphocytidyl-2-C-methyl-D-erythritol kinase